MATNLTQKVNTKVIRHLYLYLYPNPNKPSNRRNGINITKTDKKASNNNNNRSNTKSNGNQYNRKCNHRKLKTIIITKHKTRRREISIIDA